MTSKKEKYRVWIVGVVQGVYRLDDGKLVKAWENFCLVIASSPKVALNKATRMFGFNTSPLTIEEGLCEWRFEGFSYLRPLSEQLADGCELIWFESANKRLAKHFVGRVQPKEDILKELHKYSDIVWNKPESLRKLKKEMENINSSRQGRKSPQASKKSKQFSNARTHRLAGEKRSASKRRD